MRRFLRALIRGRRTVLLLPALLGGVVLPLSLADGSQADGGLTNGRQEARPTAQQCSLSLQDDHVLATTGRVAGGQPLGFTILGRAEGSCAGRSFTMELPPQLAPVRQNGSVLDSRGERVGGVLSTRSGQVRVTLRATPHHSAFAAAFAARLRYTAPPDALLRLRWRSGPMVVATTTLRTAQCHQCRRPRSRAAGRATLDGTEVGFTLESARSRTRNEHVRFSVHLARTLTVRCGRLSAHLGRNRLGRWGQLRATSRLRLHDVHCERDHALLNCSGTVITGWVRLPRAHRYAVVSVRASARDPQTSRYPVWGRVGQRHDRSGVAVVARRYVGLLQPSLDLVPQAAESPSAAASPPSSPPPTHSHPPATASETQRGPVVATTMAILAAGVIVLMVRIRRRSS